MARGHDLNFSFKHSLSPNPGNSCYYPGWVPSVSEPHPAVCCHMDSWNLSLGSTMLIGQWNDKRQVL